MAGFEYQFRREPTPDDMVRVIYKRFFEFVPGYMEPRLGLEGRTYPQIVSEVAIEMFTPGKPKEEPFDVEKELRALARELGDYERTAEYARRLNKAIDRMIIIGTKTEGF